MQTFVRIESILKNTRHYELEGVSIFSSTLLATSTMTKLALVKITVELFFRSVNRYFDENDVIHYATVTAKNSWPTAEKRRQCARSLWIDLPL